MARVAWTEEASRWLESIFEYIAEENPVAARKVVLGIHERARVLESHPEIGHRYLASTRNVRILLYGHYRIAYLLASEQRIEVLGIFHGAMDIERYLK